MLKQSSLALLFLWLRLNHPKKVTAKVSPTFSQGSPSSFASFGFTSSCSLAYVWLSSVNCLSASSSGTLEFHVRKSKPTPLKPVLQLFQLMQLINRIFPNDGVIMISSTCFGYSVLKVSKCCFKVPARRNGDCKSPSKALVNLNVSVCDEYLSFIQ